MLTRFLFDHQHPIFKNHKVYGQSLLPGMAYIDLLYQTFMDRGFDHRELSLQNLSLHRPLTVDPNNAVLLDIRAKRKDADTFEIRVEGESQGKNQGRRNLYVTAEMRRTSITAFSRQLDIQALKTAAVQSLPLETLYQRCRQSDLEHTGLMKARGTVYQLEQGVLIQLAMGQVDPAVIEQFCYNPVLIDAAGVGALSLFTERLGEEKRLFLPLHYQSFRGSEPIGRTCYVFVRHEDVRLEKELMYQDWRFYNEQGRQIAELKNFVNKLVREQGLINPDRAAGAASQTEAESGVLEPSFTEPADQQTGTVRFLQNLLAGYLEREPEQVAPQLGYYALGLDSAKLLNVVVDLERKVGAELSPILLFEYTNILELAAFLEKEYAEVFRIETASPTPAEPPAGRRAGKAKNNKRRRTRPSEVGDIAVIGMAGRYPGADDLYSFWDNLAAGVDAVSEIPLERWDWRAFSQVKSASGKDMSRWGGFLSEIDTFDPLFFNISPRQAEIMDPQERYFLEVCWSAVEDAGYRPDNLAPTYGPNQRRHVGVFAGVMHKDYSLIGVEAVSQDNMFPVSLNYAQIANRVSYTCNFHGPSMVVDTVCSSSLTAIHLALESLRSGESDVVIAGGVNLSLHPAKYIAYGITDMHSTHGRCKSFGDGGDGYVPGEGVGAVVLKPLAQALEDGDHVYAVVKAGTVNHVGAVSGISVPSPTAQAEMILDCLDKAGVDARDIGYIEAHGTGTSLGDPIEVQGLVKAFREHTEDTGFCALGSVKSNIGHAEAAAGVSGFTKAVLQLHHRTLVPSLHAEKTNPYIKFEETPFYIQQVREPWPRRKRDDQSTVPLRAGVSSFGAGGANAHVVLEALECEPERGGFSGPAVFLLSAKNEDRLRAYAARMSAFFKRNLDRFTAEPRLENDYLHRIAFTLQQGRVLLDHRLAVVVRSFAELLQALDAFLDGREDAAHVGRRDKAQLNPPRIDAGQLNRAIGQDRIDDVLKRWSQGHDVRWEALYNGRKPRRISLPSYPFARDRYWLPLPQKPRLLYPPGSFQEQKPMHLYETVSAQDPVVRHHRVRGHILYPGSGFIETAARAGRALTGQKVTGISDLLWGRPLFLKDEAVGLQVMLEPVGEHRFRFRIADSDGDYVRGTLSTEPVAEKPDPVDLAALRRRCSQQLSQEQVYQSFRERGFEYGSDLQVTRVAYGGAGEALVELALPKGLENDADLIHPALLDGALRAGLAMTDPGPAELAGPIPYSLEQLRCFAASGSRCFVHVRRRGGADGDQPHYDIGIYDPKGRETLRLDGLLGKVGKSPRTLVHQHVCRWIDTPFTGEARGARGRFLVLGDDDQVYQYLQQQLNAACLFLRVDETFAFEAGAFHLNPMDEEHWTQLFAELGEGELTLVDTVAMGSHPDLSGLLRLRAMFRVLGGRALNVLFCYPTNDDEARCFAEAVSGFGVSTTPIHHQFKLVSLGLEPRSPWPKLILGELQRLNFSAGRELRYHDGLRQEQKLVRREPAGSGQAIKIKQGGVYLISGGAGGLGLIFARYLAERYGAKLVLLGRSPLNADKQKALEELRQLGGEAIYLAADVADKETLAAALAQAEARFASFHGIIHAAGVGGDITVDRADREQFQSLLHPKLDGTLLLDRLTAHHPLDFFILFSSISSRLGDFGIAGYAAGNRFMDAFAHYRETLREQGKRAGHGISVNWPYWAEGGLGDDIVNDPKARALYFDFAGLEALGTSTGLAAFETLLSQPCPQIFLTSGNLQKIEKVLRVPGSQNTTPTQPRAKVVASAGQASDHAALEQYLREKLARVTKVPANQIDRHADFEEYGIDSVMIMELNGLLADDFPKLPSTLFFERSRLVELIDYFQTEQAEVLHRLFPATVIETEVRQEPAPLLESAAETPQSQPRDAAPEPVRTAGGIAVIGMAGRYPGAEDLEQLWQNLMQGRDCIEEVPGERWDVGTYYHPQKQAGKTYSKWGGFIKGADQFDAAFFNMTADLAAHTDPQIRLFLQSAWSAVEDAGYRKDNLADKDRRVGVFAGIMWNEYPLLAGSEHPVLPNNAALASQVSYHLDLHGPSMVLDTACSSSLYAVAMACRAIESGECESALAGGVNLSLHPNKYIGLSQAGFLSSDGRCRSFGDGGNGYVSGEGVGVVLLKSLEKAQADGDPIYAVIKGAAVNHGGKTHGVTVPNPKAQADVIAEAVRRSGLPAEQITYIEGHGTGTALGDGIEVRALGQAFARFTERKGFAALGSVKSNIGHLEGAAGIAALTKVLLQLRERKLVPSLHAQPANRDIDFGQSPVRLQLAEEPWQPGLDQAGRPLPLAAGISSFGATGTNVHILLEEAPAQILPKETGDIGPALIVLSAKNHERLRAYADRLSGFLKDRIRQGRAPRLQDLAFTLQWGRESMPARLGILADSLETVLVQLDDFLQGRGSAKYGNAEKNREALSLFTAEDLHHIVRGWVDNALYDKVLELWINGFPVDWNMVVSRQGNRIHLPGYPFAPTRHWLGESGTPAQSLPEPESKDWVRLIFSKEKHNRLGQEIAMETAAKIDAFLRDQLAGYTGVDPASLDGDLGFYELGIASARIAQLLLALKETAGVELEPAVLFEHPSIQALGDFLLRRHGAQFSRLHAYPAGPGSAAKGAAGAGEQTLSRAQAGLWVLHQINPGLNTYNVPLALRFPDGIEPQRLQNALTQLLRRHPILGSHYLDTAAGPIARRRPSLEIPICRETFQVESDAELSAYLTDKLNQPFDLEKDALVRVHQLNQGSGAVLLFTFHHIIFDGVSIITFLKDFAQAYKNDGQPLPTTQVDFADYVAGEQALLVSEEGRRRLQFWREQLAKPLPVLSFYQDHQHDAFALSKAVTRRLDRQKADLGIQFAQKRNVYPTTLYLALFIALLQKHAGQQDIIIGFAKDGRPDARYLESIGYYVDMVPIRRNRTLDPAGDDLQVLQKTVFEAVGQAYPLPELLKQLQLPRQSGIPPVFQAAFTYQNLFQDKSLQNLDSSFGTQVELVEGLMQQVDLFHLELFEKPDGLDISIKYDPRLFKRDRIETMLDDYLSALDGLLGVTKTGVTRPIPESIQRWNPPEVNWPRGKTIQDIFREMVALYGRRPAVKFRDQILSYAGLETRANQLAHHLIELGVKNRDMVALYFWPGLEMAVAWTAVLKVGGCYVPIDPSSPRDRIAFILQDCDAATVITTGDLVDSLPVKPDHILALDQVVLDGYPSTQPHVAVDPEQAAYCIYTSGSTGKPKGAMINHRNLVRLVHHDQFSFDLSVEDIWIMFHSFAFDFSIWEVYGALLRGSLLVIPEKSVVRDPEQIADFLAEEKVTVLNQTPSAFFSMAGEVLERSEKPRFSLRYVIFGGEALNPSLLRDWCKTYPQIQMVNGYGPTETTVLATFKPLSDADIRSNVSNFGKPFPTMRCYVLDKDLNPVPQGEPGELCIGGEAVGLGYYKREKLTREKFLDDPYSPGGRLYRSGDLVRRLANGDFEFLGRIDNQVKLRGYRIELGEIENKMAGFPGISQSVVVLREDHDHKHLAAFYLRGEDSAPIEVKSLRGYLGRFLPEYMVPSKFYALPGLPLTNNGKVDRRVLTTAPLEEILGLQEAERATVAAVGFGDIEAGLTEIWKAELHLDDIKPDDGFFDIGGDSILAVRIAKRIRERFEPGFKVTTLFKHPNIHALAQHLGAAAVPLATVGPTAMVEAAPQSDTADLPNYYRESLAVVGISCAFPGAENLAAFKTLLWEGKQAGRRLDDDETATLLPESLRGRADYVPLQLKVEEKYNFDPAFFGLTDEDAILMDPQTRRLLEHAWQAVEDAGYHPPSIPETGVFIAAGNSLYPAYLKQGSVSAVMADPSQYAAWMYAQAGAAPTLISYKLGLKGESLAVHSNCSSALTALRLAQRTLLAGESRYALIGGATLFPVDSLGYVSGEGLNFSPSGSCRPFDAGADGMVVGEGVGVLLVKRAEDALADGDHIYGLVRGLAVNNDGDAKVGFAAPSAEGQARVIEAALSQTGINPETIGYVEAHGTGTALGDAIECDALSEVWRRHTGRKQYCGLGSVKANIGHVDASAGIAGLIKVLLCLKADTLPASVNLEADHPDLDLADTPFFTIKENQPWPRLGDHPKRAALSSFGIGGTNAHALLEAAPRVGGPKSKTMRDLFAVPLSARDQDALERYAADLLDFLAEQGDKINPRDLAYTFQLGREAMEARVIFVVDRINALIAALGDFIAGRRQAPGVYRGADLNAEEQHADAAALIKGLRSGQLHPVARHWAAGGDVDWARAYTDKPAGRISLPTYPFEKRIFKTPLPGNLGPVVHAHPGHGPGHPLLHANTSDLNEQRYSSIFSGEEFFLRDHHIRLPGGEVSRVLSSPAQLEMAWAAVKAAGGKTFAEQSLALENVVWGEPLVVGQEGREIHIGIFPRDNGVAFEIYARDEQSDEPVVFTQGNAVRVEQPTPVTRDLDLIRAKCTGGAVDNFYGRLEKLGRYYGPAGRAVRELYRGEELVLAKVALPEAARADAARFQLHPSLLDGALHACLALCLSNELPSLPFALQKLQSFRANPDQLWVHVRRSQPVGGPRPKAALPGLEKLDVALLDENGRLCTLMEGVRFQKAVLPEAQQAEPAEGERYEFLLPTDLEN